MTSRARDLRKDSTKAERALWNQLRSRQLAGHKFRRQVPLGSYVVDFVCFEQRLVIEIDGGHHGEQAGYDRKRSDELKSRGFRVLRFWNNEVLGQPDGVTQMILEAVGQAPTAPWEGHPHPSPLPSRERG